MKNPLLCSLSFIACLLSSIASLDGAQPRAYLEAIHDNGQLEYLEQIPVLFLQGTPDELGKQQGNILREVAKNQPFLSLPRAVLKDHGGEAAWPVIVQVARAALKRAPERFGRELAAASQAASLSQAEADSFLVANALAELRRFGCSALLVEPPRSASGEMLFGRNWDYQSYGQLDRLSLVTVYRPKGLRAFASVGFPGIAGVMSGMNDAGLAIACLDSGPAKDGSPGFNPLGAPLMLTFRRLLEECGTVDEAESLLKQGKHMTWMNLAACDRQKAVVFEITPKTVATRKAQDHLLACTNHFRTPELGLSNRNACARYQKLQGWWQKAKLDQADVAKAMDEVNQGDATLQTMIFEPKTLHLHLAIGKAPASARPMVDLDLAQLFQRKVGESQPQTR